MYHINWALFLEWSRTRNVFRRMQTVAWELSLRTVLGEVTFRWFVVIKYFQQTSVSSYLSFNVCLRLLRARLVPWKSFCNKITSKWKLGKKYWPVWATSVYRIKLGSRKTLVIKKKWRTKWVIQVVQSLFATFSLRDSELPILITKNLKKKHLPSQIIQVKSNTNEKGGRSSDPNF